MKTILWKIGLALSAICLLFPACELKTADIIRNEIDNGLWDWEGWDGGSSVWKNDPAPDAEVIETDWTDLTGSGGTKITINPDRGFQVMTGFGAADAWSAAYVGQYWAEDIKQQIADWLFSREFDEQGQPKGVGLSQWRVNLGAGSQEQGMSSRVGTRNYDPNNMIGAWERRAESLLADIRNPTGNVSDVPGAIDPYKHPTSNILYDWGKMKGQRYFMEEAHKRGLETFILFSNSPPVSWTANGFANAGDRNATMNSSGRWLPAGRNGNITTAGRTMFAHYLADVAEYFKVVKGYNIGYISPFNEPQWEWNEDKQEGSPWTNAEMAAVSRLIDTQIQARPSIAGANGVKQMITESAQWDFLYDGTANNVRDQINTFFQSGSSNYIGDLVSMQPFVIAGHTYFTHSNDTGTVSVRTNVAQRAGQRGVEVWSTEWCALGGGSGYPNVNSYFDTALFMAKLAYQDIIVANAVCFDFWTAMDMERGGYARYSLIGIAPGTASYDRNSYQRFPITASGSIQSQPTLWAMGHYSLFVRPGFRRVELTGISATDYMGLMGTAYKSPAGYTERTYNPETGTYADIPVDRIVAVYVNMSNNNRRLAAEFGDDRKPKLIRCFLTNNSNTGDNGGIGMRRQPHTNGQFTVPPRSIYTVVYDF